MRRKEEKTKKIIVLFLAGIMVSSVFGVLFYGFAAPEQNYSYNGFKFTGTKEGLYQTKVNGIKTSFNYLPQELEHIELSKDIIVKLRDKYEIDMSSDMDDRANQTIALIEYSLDPIFENVFDTYLRVGFTENNTFDMPVIKCDDATDNIPVIYIRSSNQTKTYLDESCVIIEAKKPIDMVQAVERIIYGMIGVIE